MNKFGGDFPKNCGTLYATSLLCLRLQKLRYLDGMADHVHQLFNPRVQYKQTSKSAHTTVVWLKHWFGMRILNEPKLPVGMPNPEYSRERLDKKQMRSQKFALGKRLRYESEKT